MRNTLLALSVCCVVFVLIFLGTASMSPQEKPKADSTITFSADRYEREVAGIKQQIDVAQKMLQLTAEYKNLIRLQGMLDALEQMRADTTGLRILDEAHNPLKAKDAGKNKR